MHIKDIRRGAHLIASVLMGYPLPEARSASMLLMSMLSQGLSPVEVADNWTTLINKHRGAEVRDLYTWLTSLDYTIDWEVCRADLANRVDQILYEAYL